MARFQNYIVTILLAQWLVVNLLWSQGREYLDYLYHMGTWQFQGNDYTLIFPFTFAAAIILFSCSLYFFKFKLNLDWIRTTIFSISLPFAATSLFEEIYQDLGAFLHTPFVKPPFEAHLINVSSIAFGFVSFSYWQRNNNKYAYAALSAYFILWLAWVATGYTQIYQASGLGYPFLINVLLKVLSYAIFGLFAFGSVLSHHKKKNASYLEQSNTTPMKNLLQKRPEIIFFPVACIFLVVNLGGYGEKFIVSFVQYFTLQLSNQIFPFTLAFAWIVFLSTLVISLKYTHLGFTRSFIISGSLPFAGAGGFELIYQMIGAIVQPCCFGASAAAPFGPYEILSALTWVSLGFTGLGFWKLTRKFWIASSIVIAGFALWVLIGFPQVTWGSFFQYPLGYILNIGLKGGLFTVFAIPLIEGMMSKDSSKKEKRPNVKMIKIGFS